MANPKSTQSRLFVSVCVLALASVAHAQSLVPGQTYVSPDGYVEMRAGNLPLVMTVPHDGTLYPENMAVRTKALCGDPDFAGGSDGKTYELAQAIAARMHVVTGRHPWVIINKIHRSRLDANRPKHYSACGDPETGIAWDQWHAYIGLARAAVSGRGFQIDIHGHSRAFEGIHLGYLIPNEKLANPEGEIATSSLHAFALTFGGSFTTLLRDLGTRLEVAGYPSVPSESMPYLTSGTYLKGGYLTSIYGCRDASATICGVQLEHNLNGVRRYPAQRAAYAQALTAALLPYMNQLGISW
jgi:hypothetical protein